MKAQGICVMSTWGKGVQHAIQNASLSTLPMSTRRSTKRKELGFQWTMEMKSFRKGTGQHNQQTKREPRIKSWDEPYKHTRIFPKTHGSLEDERSNKRLPCFRDPLPARYGQIWEIATATRLTGKKTITRSEILTVSQPKQSNLESQRSQTPSFIHSVNQRVGHLFYLTVGSPAGCIIGK